MVFKYWKELKLDEAGLEIWQRADGVQVPVRVTHVLRAKVTSKENRADIDAIRNKLELRVCDKIATDVETAVTEILSQLATDLDTTGVKMSMKPMMGGKKTRVTLEFEDQDKRQEFRRTLVDKDNGYKPTTKLNGQNVEVYCHKPKYEIVRDDRLYKAGKQAARQRGTDFANVFVDRTNRIVTTSDGTIIAWQDQASWYARVGSPA